MNICQAATYKSTRSNEIKRKREILNEGKLQDLIEELIGKFPKAYIEALALDLRDDKSFSKILNELDISTDFDSEEEEYIEDDQDDDINLESRDFSLGRLEVDDDT